jgi:ABC-type transport system involved in cytochrome bd biosynthesis fused ATPase/permease subunit
VTPVTSNGDRIYLLERGRVAGRGTYDELTAQRNATSALLLRHCQVEVEVGHPRADCRWTR